MYLQINQLRTTDYILANKLTLPIDVVVPSNSVRGKQIEEIINYRDMKDNKEKKENEDYADSPNNHLDSECFAKEPFRNSQASESK